MNLKQYIQTRKTHDKTIIIYDNLLPESESQTIWKGRIIISEKKSFRDRKIYHGLSNIKEIKENENLIKEYGKRKVDIIDKEYNQIIINLL